MTTEDLMEGITRCPEHAEPDSDRLHAWACPDDCPHFHAELSRRIDDMKINGNYTRVTFRGRGSSSRMFRQRFQNHKPVTGWMLWSPKAHNKMSALHTAYRRKSRGWR